MQHTHNATHGSIVQEVIQMQLSELIKCYNCKMLHSNQFWMTESYHSADVKEKREQKNHEQKCLPSFY